jgi:hypothetical protein
MWSRPPATSSCAATDAELDGYDRRAVSNVHGAGLVEMFEHLFEHRVAEPPFECCGTRSVRHVDELPRVDAAAAAIERLVACEQGASNA